jgi:hypothetical protein
MRFPHYGAVALGSVLLVGGLVFCFSGGSDGEVFSKTPGPLWFRLSFGILLAGGSAIAVAIEFKNHSLEGAPPSKVRDIVGLIMALVLVVLLAISLYGFTVLPSHSASPP